MTKTWAGEPLSPVLVQIQATFLVFQAAIALGCPCAGLAHSPHAHRDLYVGRELVLEYHAIALLLGAQVVFQGIGRLRDLVVDQHFRSVDRAQLKIAQKADRSLEYLGHLL